MHSELSANFEEIKTRLVVLERQNRRFKQLGAVALIVPLLILIMGQLPPKKIIEANELILKDDSGHVRARLWVNPTRLGGAPEMYFFDDNGERRLWLDGGPGKSTDGGGSVNVYDGHGSARGYFTATVSSGAILSIFEPENATKHLGQAVLAPGLLSVTDGKGFSAALGVQSLQTPGTGATHETSAASLVLFDKDKNVIWKTP